MPMTRFRYGALGIPAKLIDPFMNKTIIAIESSRVVCCNSPIDTKIVPHVACLLYTCSPVAVVGCVVSIVVASFQRVALRPLAHISDEIPEVHPTVANLDAATSVIRIPRKIEAATAIAHVAPHVIQRMLSLEHDAA
jgi:hypothetical protein